MPTSSSSRTRAIPTRAGRGSGFVPTDRADHEEPARTAVIFIERTRQDALQAAKALDRYNLIAMLRSVT